MPGLDSLLGRQSLKDRIAELEAERDRLEAQLDAEQDRRTAAVRHRQEAQERVNHLEDRIAGLEGELNRLEDDEVDRSWERVVSVHHDRMAELLGRLERVRTEAEGALSAAVVDEIPDAVRSTFENHWSLLERISPCLVYADDVRLVRAVLDPPRSPDPFVQWDGSFRIAPRWFTPTDNGSFALIRADLFALGTYEDGELEFVEGFASEVMGRHTKGGFSQGRFERRREGQIEDHIGRSREILRDRDVDDLILVGDRRPVDRLREFASTTATVDATGAPEDALGTAFREFWTTRVYIP